MIRPLYPSGWYIFFLLEATPNALHFQKTFLDNFSHDPTRIPKKMKIECRIQKDSKYGGTVASKVAITSEWPSLSCE